MHRAFKAAILFALTSFNLWGSTSKTFAENPQVNVSLYNDAQVPPDILVRAEEQAAKIFSRARLDVTWLRCTHINSGVRAAACNGFDVPGQMVCFGPQPPKNAT